MKYFRSYLHDFYPIFLILFMICIIHVWSKDVTSNRKAIEIDGQSKIINSGSIHYPRSTPQMWSDLIKKAKDGGLNTIETYVFWNAHEPKRRQYDFSGNLDLIKFLKIIKEQGLYAFLRIGPYICAEWNYGGFPVWLHHIPGIKMRTANAVFMNEMQNFTMMIVGMLKREKLFASQGGPIILSQFNQLFLFTSDNVKNSYGDEGKSYIEWCEKLALSLKIGVPWIMCRESDAPQPIMDACNGWYCDQFYPKHSTPKIWSECWTGWFNEWGGKNPHRTAEDLAFAVARFFQYGGTVLNYYMYHGGTNFGRMAGGPYISTTYSYDAPLDEYGNLNQPKWGHLRQLHLILASLEDVLTHGEVKNIDYGNMMSASIYEHNGRRLCFFGNANEHDDITITHEGKKYTVAAWSVSILPDCVAEVYNTARVNSQTSIMVKRPNETEDESNCLDWSWRAETIELHEDQFFKRFTSMQLEEQKMVTNDTSDYLWYMTSVDINDNGTAWGEEIILEIHTKGHIIHAFVNKEHVGSQWAENKSYKFAFRRTIKLNKGKNYLSLLSVTVGLPNSGANFDEIEQGILGPIKLIGRNDRVKDLSMNMWSYKVGLEGEENKFYNVENVENWQHENLPFNTRLVWYKALQTNFSAPMGKDPIVVDLLGLSKGIAWVNGHNIGRYWPSFLVGEDGCQPSCDFHGAYSSNKCATNCGKSSQRWYHVPRSFLHDGNNTLVLMEEFGGSPLLVNFRTVTIGKACGNGYEGNSVELSCQGGKNISNVTFASYGDPKGNCESFEKGSCESPNTLSVIKKECIGQESCSIDVSEDAFGPTGCSTSPKRLVVEAIC
ncbi:hypothetical protein Pfo_005448 [Paulownia fortunei]|nr:hypothetical protein Pfo_005448 [Paulownia fortunei]